MLSAYSSINREHHPEGGGAIFDAPNGSFDPEDKILMLNLL